jgi:hypothetical protein
MSDAPQNRKKPRGSFALAIVAYVLGVAVFSLWSYAAQRGMLLEYSGLNAVRTNALLRGMAIRHGIAGMSLLALAVPLVVRYNRARSRAAEELAQLNARLQEDVENRKGREDELRDAIRDLERFNAVATGRENRIIELKNEVNALLEQMNRGKKYNVGRIE